MWFCTWWTVHVTCLDERHHLSRSWADLLRNVHKTHARKASPEAELLDVIVTKVLRVFLLAIHFHLYSRILLPPSLGQKWFETGLPCKHCIRKTQVWEFSGLCPETSTKLSIYEFAFWTPAILELKWTIIFFISQFQGIGHINVYIILRTREVSSRCKLKRNYINRVLYIFSLSENLAYCMYRVFSLPCPILL